MDSATLVRHGGFATLRAHLMQLIDALILHITDHHTPEARHVHLAAG